MVVVVGRSSEGHVLIRDPAHGTSYETPYADFISAWVGEAEFKR